MREALALAAHAVGLSDPNPRVGCVIVGADGRLAGRGHTQEAGGAHAEVMALRDAAARGVDVRGATVYVTLEPCSHHGRTPPCADALVAAGVGRVVIALRDPNPLVSGRGAARLEAAGIAVEWGGGGEESRELNIGFVSRMERGRPWLRLKAAVSLDGRTALADGTSQWITGEAARADGHAWRKRASAVLTGVGTVREDDPRLDVRLVATARQPLRVVVDSRLETPPSARILAPPGSVLVYAAVDDAERRQALEDRAPRSCCCPIRPARSTSRRCSPTWAGAASTSSTSRPARSSTRRCSPPAWSTSCSSTSRRAWSAAAAAWPRSRRSRASTRPSASRSRASSASAPTCGCCCGRGGRPERSRPIAAWRHRRLTLSAADACGDATALAPARTIGACSPASSAASAGSSTSTPLGTDASFGKALTIEAPAGWLGASAIGDSIALAGACMTVVSIDAAHHRFQVEVSAESLAATHGLDATGDVNLEKALRAGDRLDGHLVSGHVDGVGTVDALRARRRIVAARGRRAARRWRATSR